MKTTGVIRAVTTAAAVLTRAHDDEMRADEAAAMYAWHDDIYAAAPACYRACVTDPDKGEDGSLAPPCAAVPPLKWDTDEDNEQSYRAMLNGWDCLCADRIWQRQRLACVLRECTGLSAQEGLNYALTLKYSLCAIESHMRWPPPPALIDELCLTDHIPDNVIIPDSVPYFDDQNAPARLREYPYADEWPAQTATTYVPPRETRRRDVRAPLECRASTRMEMQLNVHETREDERGGGLNKPLAVPRETWADGVEEWMVEDEEEEEEEEEEAREAAEEEKETMGDGKEAAAASSWSVSVVIMVTVAGVVGALAIVL